MFIDLLMKVMETERPPLFEAASSCERRVDHIADI